MAAKPKSKPHKKPTEAKMKGGPSRAPRGNGAHPSEETSSDALEQRTGAKQFE